MHAARNVLLPARRIVNISTGRLHAGVRVTSSANSITASGASSPIAGSSPHRTAQELLGTSPVISARIIASSNGEVSEIHP
jgi:hypothetical protein